MCTPKSPSCIRCPFLKTCQSRKAGTFLELPLKRKKKPVEIWKVDFEISKKGTQFLMAKNTRAPFLKGEYLFPLKVKKLKSKPAKYKFKHSITHHNIYVDFKSVKNISSLKDSQWVKKNNLKKISPFSLIQKTLNQLESKNS